MTNFTQLCNAICLALFSVVSLSAQVVLNETFDGAIPDTWTTMVVTGNGQASENWVYTATGPAGAFAVAPLNSTTSSNGWAIFDSDLNCNAGVGQEAWLISPMLDISQLTRVILSFETYYVKFNDRAFVRIGTDLNDMANWQSIRLFEDVDNNSTGGSQVGSPGLNPQNILLDITDDVNGLTDIYVAFQFLSDENTVDAGDLFGCAFSWQIDDVIVTSLENEVILLNPAEAPSYVMPLLLADTIEFGALIDNAGRSNVASLSINASIDKRGENFFSTTAMSSGPIRAGDSVIVSTNETYVPVDTGVFVISYEIDTAGLVDEIRANNTNSVAFQISQGLLSKDDDRITNATQPLNITGSTWEIGNYYSIPDKPLDTLQATSMLFSIASNRDDNDDPTHLGKTVNVFLYEIANDDIPDVFDDNDVEVVAFGTHELTNEDNFATIETQLFNSSTGNVGVDLKANTEYLAMVQYDGEMFVPFSELVYNYSFATVVNNNGWFLGGFGPGVTCMARLRLNIVEGGVTSVNAPTLDSDQFTVFPNPVSDQLTVNFDLKDASKVVRLKMMDMRGVTVETRIFENAISEQFEWNVQDLPNGTYLLNITTDEGVRTRRVKVQR